jgi:hypothetical protein|tara:strand:+ start:1377 stop:1766 length:390 start_codon:yes stop_codon:yes gene_type:complete
MSLKVLQALNRWEKKDFDYGSVDCCQFTGFIVKELTGKDYLADFYYNSEEDAESIVRDFGDLEDTAVSVLGYPTEDIQSLKDGSPVIVSLPGGKCMGIKLGAAAVCLVKKGFIKIPEQYISSGWDLCQT